MLMIMPIAGHTFPDYVYYPPPKKSSFKVGEPQEEKTPSMVAINDITEEMLDEMELAISFNARGVAIELLILGYDPEDIDQL